jgi:hemolysin activation/secretion protein
MLWPRYYLAFLLLSLVLSNLFPVSVSAQDAGALQRELQLQLERSEPLPQVPTIKPAEIKQRNPNDQKVAIKGFRFQGNTLLSDAQLQAEVKPWTNTSITFGDLKDVTAAIQNLYAKNNRIAQAVAPPQDISNGIILIQITEGKLGSVVVEPLTKDAVLRVNSENAKKYILVKNETGQFIDVEPIQRGVSLLNELPGVQASGEFFSGNTFGESNFRVKLNDGPLFTGQASLTNYGSKTTGIGQATANLSLNNPSGFGDQAALDVIQSLGSTYAQVGYSIPVGHQGWRVGAQANYLIFETLANVSSPQVQGNASTVSANLTYALARGAKNNTNLRFSIDDRNYSNSQLGENISQYQITSASAGVNGNYFDTPSSVVSYGATLTAGNLRINNLTQAGQDETGPGTAGSYQKLGFTLSRTQELDMLPRTSWLVSLYGQFANKNLNSAEQIYLGGPFGVRAYPTGQGGGSQGAIFSTELQHRFDQNWQFGVFVDFGVIQQYVTPYEGWQGLTNANNNYQLGSLGPTVKFVHGRWLVNAVAAFPIGSNPLFNSMGERLNADSTNRAVQWWVRAQYAF